jgi:hypothetical protein
MRTRCIPKGPDPGQILHRSNPLFRDGIEQRRLGQFHSQFHHRAGRQSPLNGTRTDS